MNLDGFERRSPPASSNINGYDALGPTQEGQQLHEELHLPQQLSPAVLAVLLEDLIEYNGISYRNVPLRTFRGKYIGLYFGTIESPVCEAFLEHLRGFYNIINHKFECVLVSSDGSEDSYNTHTQLTSWPSYPRGDLRATLLRSHFNVKECPTLVILDSNGIVITSRGVEKLIEDQGGFPWNERVIDSLWGEPSATKAERGLLSVLSDLELPPNDDIPATDHCIVGLLFGELWCPDTREMIKRVEFLLENYTRRLGYGVNRQIAMYFVHCDEIDKYSSLLNFSLPFEEVWIEDEFRRQATHHFLDVTDIPKFCVVSPKEGWMVQDGLTWLRKDPTGVCFPWQPTHHASSGAADGFVNSLHKLSEEDLSRDLVRGPVFVAFLHDVNTQRQDTVATLRAVATAYVTRVNDKGRIIREESMDLTSMFDGSQLLNPDGSPIPPGGLMESLRRDLTRPIQAKNSLHTERQSDRLRESRASAPFALVSQPKGGVLWNVLKKAVERNTCVHGTAPWNNPGAPAHYSSHRTSMSFCYSTQKDAVSNLIQGFCETDVKHLQQHQLWCRAMAQRAANEQRVRAEMLQQFTQVTADTSSFSASLPGQPSAEPKDSGNDRDTASLGKDHTDAYGEGQEDDVDPQDKREDDAKLATSAYLPKSTYSAVSKLTEELMGTDDKTRSGTAMIIDLLKGVYYVCGNLLDKESILRFLDAWDQGNLDPFEIRMPNAEEMIKDEEQDVVREMAMYSQLTTGIIPDANTTVIPGIVIWIPSRSHSESHMGSMGPDSIFRALLNLAVQKCPREEKLSAHRLGVRDCEWDEDETGQRDQTKYLPWIEKFWVFGLLDTEDAHKEADAGSWQPASAHFLSELYSYVDDLVKRQAAIDHHHHHNRSSMSGAGDSPARRLSSSMNHYMHRHGGKFQPEEMLIPPTDLFDEGLSELRTVGSDAHAIAGNNNVCMRTARTRRSLHASLVDELCYHSLVQTLPPPLFVLLVGDLPPVDAFPWPTMLQVSHLHVLGSVPSVSAYREVCPALSVQSWNSWAESTADDRISAQHARHIAVPWS